MLFHRMQRLLNLGAKSYPAYNNIDRQMHLQFRYLVNLRRKASHDESFGGTTS